MQAFIFCQIVSGEAHCHTIWEDDMIFEGFGVDHIHAKLFPMHGTAHMKEWKPLNARVDKYFEHYEGYISSHDYKRADDKTLEALAKRIREADERV